MNKKELHKKIDKALDTVELNNIIDAFSSIEYLIQQTKTPSNMIFIPKESNFQLPSQFLVMRPNNHVDKLFTPGNELIIDTGKLHAAIEFTEEIELENNQSTYSEEKKTEKQIENLLRDRYI